MPWPEAADGLRGVDEIEWLDRVEAEYANLRLTVAFAIEVGDRELAASVVGDWTPVSFIGRRLGVVIGELCRAVSDAFDLSDDPPLQSRILALVNMQLTLSGEIDSGIEVAERAVEFAETSGSLRPGTLLALGFPLVVRDFCRALEQADRAVALSADVDQQWLSRATLAYWKAVAMSDDAQQIADQCLAAVNTGHNPTTQLFALTASVVAHTSRQLRWEDSLERDAVLAMIDRCIELARRLRNHLLIALNAARGLRVRVEAGMSRQQISASVDSTLAAILESGDRFSQEAVLAVMAVSLLACERYEIGTQVLSAAERFISFAPTTAADRLRYRPVAEDALGFEGFASACEQGRHLTTREALALVQREFERTDW